MSEELAGGCLCGAVRYVATIPKREASACHCGQCRRWTGGPLISVFTKALRFEQGEPKLVKSSDWAERGFCGDCGSGLFWRMTIEGALHGVMSVNLGTLDEPDGFELTKEWFIDRKPDSYALAGERERVTEEEAFAMLDDAK